MVSVRKQLEGALAELHERVPEIQGAIVSRSDGLLIADNINVDVNRNVMAAMVASLSNVGKRVSTELNKGATKTIIIDSEQGYIVVMEIKPHITLATILKPGSNIGLVLLEMQRSIEKIKKML